MKAVDAKTEFEWNGKEVKQDFDKMMFKSLYEGAAIIEGGAKANAPADMGQLRGSITKEVTSKVATIGTNDEKAPHVEFGTRPHKAPISALKGWAERHGIPVGAVWGSIAKKGTKAQPFLYPAFTKNIERIKGIFKKNGINLKWVQK